MPRRTTTQHPDFVPFRPKKGVFASANTCAKELISIDLAQENVLDVVYFDLKSPIVSP
jgi:hypothetical protein